MNKLKRYYQRFKSFSLFKKGLILFGTCFLLGIIFVFSLFFAVKWSIITTIPSKEELLSINNPIATEIYAKDGKLFGKFYDENRSELNPEDLTEGFKNALIATEDVRFYKHNGLDYRALGRVIVKSILLQRDNSGGGSTLTQQLVKNLYKRKRFWALSLIMNKFREIAIAQKLEKVYSKDEIILLYTNTVSFGERAFGLSTASNRFFGKHPSELNLQESATLVGILKAPTYYSPKKNPERCTTRRNIVLGQMYKYEFIENEEFQAAIESELKLNYKSVAESTGLARYFQQFIKREFAEWSKENPKENGEFYEIKRDGLRIYTSLDYNMQIAAELSMQSHMKKLQGIFDRSWKTGAKYGPNEKHFKTELKNNPRYKSLKKAGKTDKEIQEILSEKNPRQIWTWDGSKEMKMSTIDSIKYYMGLLHTGVLAVEPSTGKINAYVGGIDYGKFQWDNVQSPRQVGSTFKPIVYLTALESGVTECDYFANEKRVYTDYKDWTPENSDGKYGGYLSVKEALTRSVNTVSVQMMFKAGIDKAINQARKLGIKSKLPSVPSLVLGTADIPLFEMVKAYAAIANGGESPPLYGITKIEDAEGNVLYEKEQSIPFQESEAHSALYSIMANVANEGTGARVYNYDIPFQVMGKTGTTQNQTDGWFIAYTKDLVIGSWVGAQNRGMHFRNLGTGSGGRTALPMVGSLFEFAASQNYRPAPILVDVPTMCPDSISQEEYDILQEYPGDFDKVYASRNGLDDDIIDIIFGNDPRDDRRDYPDGDWRNKRKTRNSSGSSRTKKKRQNDFDKFRKQVERDLKDLFKVKKKKKKRRRGN